MPEEGRGEGKDFKPEKDGKAINVREKKRKIRRRKKGMEKKEKRERECRRKKGEG